MDLGVGLLCIGRRSKCFAGSKMLLHKLESRSKSVLLKCPRRKLEIWNVLVGGMGVGDEVEYRC